MKNNPASAVLGLGLVVFSMAILYTAHGAFSRFDRAERIAQSLPPLLDRADAVSDKVIAASAQLKASATLAKDSLPEVGSKVGEAGANALRNFADKYRKNKDAAPAAD